ncbi:MAG: Smr/MutS family protein, partial [Gemmatimonadales bacterium]
MTRRAHITLHRAFDEARFGTARTLDVRTPMLTGAEAVRRAEPWLRERQMSRAGEVLVITGRGRGSPGGIAVVREAVRKLLGTLKRKGVVAAVAEHTPGSWVVTLAPVRALFEAVPR